MSQLTLIDICLRFLCLGQLLFFLAWVIARGVQQKALTFERALLGVLIVCCMAAVILTMYYRPPIVHAARPILLAFTDGLPFVFWGYVMLCLRGVQLSPRSIVWLKIGGTGYLLWHLYFFIINQGKGQFHDVLHLGAGLMIAHVIYHSVVTWRDDLVDFRRRRRAVFLVAACAVVVLYVASEISNIRFMRSELGSLIGAGVMLSLSISFGVFCYVGLVPDSYMLVEKKSSEELIEPEIPIQHKALYQRLTNFMDNRGFTESRLTLSRLAERLESKEHRLRSLINQNLGYRNFSTYLNNYRLPLAREWLRDSPELSITDIALNLGYGSITSFNRAFKLKYGVPPRDFRATTLDKR